MTLFSNLKQRLRAAGIHFLCSLLISGLAALLVFWVLFPGVFREVSGGQELFFILVTVDVILGPLLTFTVFNLAKSKRELTRDIAVIALIQVAALLYGLWTVHEARPVFLVHEVDRFQVVTAADVDPPELAQARAEFQHLPLWGIQTIGVRQPKDGEEQLKSLDLALAGKDVAMRPGWWEPLNDSHRTILQSRGKPLAAIKDRKNYDAEMVQSLLKEAGAAPDDVLVFPLVARNMDWSLLLNRHTMKVVGYLHVDGF